MTSPSLGPARAEKLHDGTWLPLVWDPQAMNGWGTWCHPQDPKEPSFDTEAEALTRSIELKAALGR